ncbi:hypothetical protein [Saccharibacillus deserti]|uniref:hypothetical protein n=1 Tax=Saccharibacillus deserti TaxID=1634444 RepID=UPI0015527480|nr:hypothetical protein [Saccharibacillus deserti]
MGSIPIRPILEKPLDIQGFFFFIYTFINFEIFHPSGLRPSQHPLSILPKKAKHKKSEASPIQAALRFFMFYDPLLHGIADLLESTIAAVPRSSRHIEEA